MDRIRFNLEFNTYCMGWGMSTKDCETLSLGEKLDSLEKTHNISLIDIIEALADCLDLSLPF